MEDEFPIVYVLVIIKMSKYLFFSDFYFVFFFVHIKGQFSIKK